MKDKSKANILIGCEESQTLCKKFREAGFSLAYSCDILPTLGDPEYHYQCCIKQALVMKKWDLVILHPDCTALSLSGNRHYAKGKPFYNQRLRSIYWTLDLWDLAIKNSHRVALENPLSVIFTQLKLMGVPVFYTQPYEHGHGECKKTGFALHNLPALRPSNKVKGREKRVFFMSPSKTRKRDRSKTYEGIAQAIVDQWGGLAFGDRAP